MVGDARLADVGTDVLEVDTRDTARAACHPLEVLQELHILDVGRQVHQVFLRKEDNLWLEQGWHFHSVQNYLHEALYADHQRPPDVCLGHQALEVQVAFLCFLHYLSQYLIMHLGDGPLAAEAHSPIELHGTHPAGQGTLVRPFVHLGEEFLS